MFLLFESYFLFRRQVSNISIQDDIIFIEYFVCLKKNKLSSKILDAKLKTGFEASYRSSSKKFTLYIWIKNIKFSINRLDAFNENELMSFYKFYLAKSEDIKKSPPSEE